MGKRIAAALICLALLFSLFFLAVEAKHDCMEEGCSVCVQLRLCEGLCRSIALVPMSAALLWAVSSVFTYAPLVETRLRSVSPITLKVKLSN